MDSNVTPILSVLLVSQSPVSAVEKSPAEQPTSRDFGEEKKQECISEHH